MDSKILWFSLIRIEPIFEAFVHFYLGLISATFEKLHLT